MICPGTSLPVRVQRAQTRRTFKQWNNGLKLATGQYVWIAEADDYADERFLEILVDRLEQNPECGMAYCNSLAVDASSHIIELVQPSMYDVHALAARLCGQ